MRETAVTALQVQREALLSQAQARLNDQSAATSDELERLLDLGAQPGIAALMAQIEAEGRDLAEAHAPLDARLEGLERSADALMAALADVLADDDAGYAATLTHLHRAHRTYITALARGFQQGNEQQAQAEQARTHFQQRRLLAVQQINGLTNSTLDIEEVLQMTAQIVAAELPIDLCAIFLHDDNMTNELSLHATSVPGDVFSGQFVIHLGEQITGAIAQRSAPGGVVDISEWTVPPVETQLFGRSYRGVYVMPIICFGGESSTLEGALTLLKHEPLELQSEEKSFLELVAGLLALSVENSKVYHHAEEARLRQFSNIAVLQSVSATVATSFDLQRVLQMIISTACQMSGAPHGAIFLLEPSHQLHIGARHNLDDPSLSQACVNVGQCCVGRAVEQRDRVWGMDCMHSTPDCYLHHLSDQMHHAHSSLAVPLVSKGLVEGVLHLVRSDRHVQPSIHAKMVETFANEAAIAIESSRLYEETRTSLEVKSYLLHEMHHRVKNNMLSIAAILRMERRRTSSPEAAQVLAESISRIDGMAATHDLLSREEHIGTANIGDIATKLVGVVSAYLVPPDLRVVFEVKTGTHVEVHSKKALVLALVLNELLMNAVEHGMEDRTSGCVWIGAWEADERVHCVVADDGVGLPPELNIAQLLSLGLALVHDMTRDQLHGTFELRRGPLPEPMRDVRDDTTEWTLAELIFPPERETLPGAQS
jgi:two-component sensor histidine kinase